jgi:hypothetical protein
MIRPTFPTRWKNDRPPPIEDFVARFGDDYACADYLARKRWPDGFVCPHCGSRKAWRLEARPWIWECSGKGSNPRCRKQTSVIAGTIMHGTHLPLRKWFLAAYLMATHSNGISALQLQPKLGVTYKTAWLLLHKIRKAMVDPDRTPLSGDVDVDESAFLYKRKDNAHERGGGSSTATQIWFAGAVELRGKHGVGRIRLARIADRSAASIVPFVVQNTVPGCHLRTDSLAAYNKVPDRKLAKVNLSKSSLPAHITFKWIHLVFGNLKRWAYGTFHGFREPHLDAYLNEFVFRWNRRRRFQSTMDIMLGIGRRVGPLTYRQLVHGIPEKVEMTDEEFAELHPSRQRIIEDLVSHFGAGRDEVAGNLRRWIARLRRSRTNWDEFFGRWDINLHAVPELMPLPRRVRRKRPLDRPVLPPRRQGEERLRGGRYWHPPRPPLEELKLGYMRHVPQHARR